MAKARFHRSKSTPLISPQPTSKPALLDNPDSFTRLMGYMDRVDQALLVPMAEVTDAEPGSLDPAVEAALPKLQAVYAQQLARPLSTSWLRRALAATGVPQLTQKLQIRARLERMQRRGVALRVGAWLTIVGTVGGFYTYLDRTQTQIAQGFIRDPHDIQATQALTALMHHLPMMLWGGLGVLLVLVAVSTIGHTMERLASDDLKEMEDA